MTELMKFESSDLTTISSREIAELTGKLHRNVLADCDLLNANYKKMGLAEISAGVYSHPSTGSQSHREFLLTKIQTFDLMTGYNIELRIKINRRWAELESKQTKQLPVNYKDALIALVSEIEKTEQLQIANESLNTKLDNLLEWVSILKVAQHNGVKETKFNWRVLKAKSEELDFMVKRAESPRFGYQNIYHVNVFKACYPFYDYELIFTVK